MQNINLKIEQVNGNEIIIRDGKALELSLPEKINISGDINTVKTFLSKRYNADGYSLQNVDTKRSIIIVDKNKMTIVLKLDPENKFGAEIKGSLEVSDELATFHINQPKTFTRDELIKIIRFNKLAFDNSEKHAELLKSYQAFTAQTATDLKQESDLRGNKNAAYNKTVNTNIPTEFILLIPIFKGKEAQRFRVEICLDVTDGGARFWFESTELHELIETQKEIIFNEELKDFTSDFVIINV
ncbi:MAG: hypothetical protein JST87_05430 [Bacteroidetes bacterium]|nr:hypothetical protein [Bacteroidota bacterium]